MKATLSVKFDDKISAQLDRLRRDVPIELRKAQLREGYRVFAISQDRCPVDTGRLRASGGVGMVGNQTIVYYGTDYAGIVDAIHPNPSKRGYLSRTFQEAIPGMGERIAADALRIAGVPSA